MGAYGINIVGLSNKEHHFDYEIGEAFFRKYGSDLLSEGAFHADVMLFKHETFLEAEFKIKGVAKLVCDRTLEPFDFPVLNTHKIVFKYGDADEEITDEIVIIHRDTATLELGQYIYEFIGLAIPLKKLHPRFKDEEEAEDDDIEGKIVYSSGSPDDDSDDDNDEDIDPRWNILKKLK
ncbi:DUF177 domain-containing protein [Chryseolinea sp. Jin1]|uniref:DUF177 domain-containing protein n=2 Tax=Chryseolinea lacunae TaxID=2801331 RepID=A0ABS1KTY2_9BACT|nr:DUF177 domain-containing protein [Chryseolinea lacunae]